MSASVFEKLLGSYSGMRKRTWNPGLIEEAKAELSDEQKTTVSNIYQVVRQFMDTQPVGATQQGLGDKRNITIEKVSNTMPRFTGSNLGTLNFKDFNNRFNLNSAAHPQGAASKLLAAWSPKKEEEGEKSKKEGEDKEEKKAPEQEAAKFSEGFVEKVGSFLDKLGVRGGVVGFLDNLQNKINTPSKGSKTGKFVEWLLEEAPPEISSQGRQSLSKATENFLSIASKVRTVDGQKVIVGLTGEEREALKVITIRNNGTVYFGRPGEAVPGYEVLQENASEHGDGNYGFCLGNSLKPMGDILNDARILPEGVDIENVSKEDIESFDTIQKSKASAAAGNDATGKLEELVHLAALADKETSPIRKRKHLSKLKDALEEFGINPELLTDPDTPVSSETYETLESIAEQIQDADGAPVFLKNLLMGMARGNDEYMKRLNLQEGDIILSMGMGQESVMGERADTVSFVSPDANIDTKILQGKSRQKVKLRTVGKVTIGENGPEFESEEDRELFTTLALARVREKYTKEQWRKLSGSKKGKQKIAQNAARILKNFPYDKLEGAQVIGPSIKNMQSESDTARTGSCQASKMYGAETRQVDEETVPTGRAQYDSLVDSTLDREIAAGTITEDQKSQIKEHLDEQRQMWQEVENTVGKFDEANTKDFNSFLTNLTEIGTSEQAKKTLGELKTLLKSKSPTDRERAKLMLFQLKRVRKAERDSSFARSVAVTDLIGSAAAKGPEPMYINQRTRTLVGNNHAMISHAINEAVNGTGKVEVREARTSVYTEDGTPLFSTRRVSRKGKSPQIESEMHKSILEATLKQI